MSLPVGELRWTLQTRWPTCGAKPFPLGIVSGHGSDCAHEGGPTRAGESTREAMSRPACGSVTGPRGAAEGRSSTATLLDGNRCRRPEQAGVGVGAGGPWVIGGRLPAPTARGGARWGIEGIEGIEGVRGWASWPGEMGGLGASAGADEREEGRGQWWPGKTRQFAVGHARGAFPGAVIREGASRGVSPSIKPRHDA